MFQELEDIWDVDRAINNVHPISPDLLYANVILKLQSDLNSIPFFQCRPAQWVQ